MKNVSHENRAVAWFVRTPPLAVTGCRRLIVLYTFKVLMDHVAFCTGSRKVR